MSNSVVHSFTRTLGNRYLLDIVDVPVINEYGEVGHARMLIGSGVQLMIVTVASIFPELVDRDALAHILWQSADKNAARARPFGGQDLGNIDEFAYAPAAFEL